MLVLTIQQMFLCSLLFCTEKEKQFKDPHDTLGNKLPSITREVGMLLMISFNKLSKLESPLFHQQVASNKKITTQPSVSDRYGSVNRNIQTCSTLH